MSYTTYILARMSTPISPWPPTSLQNNISSREIISYCEDMEVSGKPQEECSCIVHMAALLYQQDWIAAVHLYQRAGSPPALLPWYEAAIGARSGVGIMAALQKASSESSVPAATYVEEIAHAYQTHVRNKPWRDGRPPSMIQKALGFSEIDSSGRSASRVSVPIVAFLEATRRQPSVAAAAASSCTAENSTDPIVA